MTKHFFCLNPLKPQHVFKGGYRIDGNSANFPELKGMALSSLVLNKKSFREPHWHPNANELLYCIEGSGEMTIFIPGSFRETFTLEKGDIVFVPMGYLHYIHNMGDSTLRLVLCYDNDTPQDINLSNSINCMADHVLAATYGLSSDYFFQLKKTFKQSFICEDLKEQLKPLPLQNNKFKMHLDETHPQILTKGGYVKMSNGNLFPILEGLAVYVVKLEKEGMREPHWHPNASELNFLVTGSARIRLLSPNGEIETFDMVGGDMSFLPKGYFHHIENIGEEPAFFVIFFNHIFPSDIGLSGSLGAFPTNVLASIFDSPSEFLNQIPKYQTDLFVISGGG
jgi:oxalate decarboxylase